MKSTTAKRIARTLLAATAMSAASIAGLAGVAGADTIAPAPHSTGPIIANPTPQPQPDPPAPEPELPIAQPDPQPEPPAPQPADLPIAQPLPGGDPEPFDPPIAQPQPDPEPEPQFPTDGEITADPCTVITHGCGDDDGSIDDFTNDPGTGTDDGTDDSSDDEVETAGEETVDTPDVVDEAPADRGALPRTGAAGIAVLAAVGTALTAAGVATKKAAKA